MDHCLVEYDFIASLRRRQTQTNLAVYQRSLCREVARHTEGSMAHSRETRTETETDTEKRGELW